MQPRVLSAILCGIAAVIMLSFLVYIYLTDREEPKTTEMQNGEIVMQRMNGTTAQMVYKVGNKYYLLERAGYGKPEQSVWDIEREVRL